MSPASRRARPTPTRAALVLTVLVGTVLALTVGTAAAHVSVDPPVATKGAYVTIGFVVPNERAEAETVKLRVQMPPDHPFSSVTTRPVPGWTITTEKSAPPPGTPGNQTESVSVVTWEGGKIGPGQFERFEVSLGPLPEDADGLVFKAIQTYSNGEESAWIEEVTPGGEEPEMPAPELRLVDELVTGSRDEHGEAVVGSGTGSSTGSNTGSSSGSGASSPTTTAAPAPAAASSTSDGSGLASISLGIGVVALGVALAGLYLALRARPATTT